jgi:hypothetical protein
MINEPIANFPGTGITIYRLDKIGGGTEGLTARIPEDTGGVYAWFRSFNELTSDDGRTAFWSTLSSPKSLPREAIIRPIHKVTLESHTAISPGKKEMIQSILDSDGCWEDLQQILLASFLFQQPLYVGKAKNFRKRITDHLEANSDLLDRLEKVNVDINQCILITYETPKSKAKISGIPSDTLDSAYEEIFSRLFMPTFTKRYG